MAKSPGHGNGEPAVQKVVSRFNPAGTHPIEQSEAHYTRVHVPYASSFFQRDPRYLAYYTSRVEAQYSRAGSFSHIRTAWRFVTTYLAGLAMLSGDKDATALNAAMMLAMSKDIPHCLRNLRRCPVQELVLVGATGQRMGEVTYLFEYDANPGQQASEQDRERLLDLSCALADRATTAQGFRSLVLDLVIEESEVAALAESGQAYTGRVLASNKVGYLWATFDNERLGDQFLADPATALHLLPSDFWYAAGYRLSHQCEFDLRGLA